MGSTFQTFGRSGTKLIVSRLRCGLVMVNNLFYFLVNGTLELELEGLRVTDKPGDSHDEGKDSAGHEEQQDKDQADLEEFTRSLIEGEYSVMKRVFQLEKKRGGILI